MNQSLIAIDQFFNTLVWSRAEGFGYADETISARAYRLGGAYPRTWGVFEYVIDTLFFWQVDHCRMAYLAEISRRQYPKAYAPEA